LCVSSAVNESISTSVECALTVFLAGNSIFRFIQMNGKMWFHAHNGHGTLHDAKSCA